MSAPQGRSRLILPLGYLLVGVAWAVGVTLLLGGAGDQPLPARFVSSLQGVGLVVATAGLLFLLQARARSQQQESNEATPARLASGTIPPAMVLAIIASGVLLAGVMLYQQQAAEVSRRAEDNLANLTELTARRIEGWLDECRMALEFAGRNPLLAHAILNRRTFDDDIRRPDMKGGLDVLRLSEGFERLQVFAPGGEPIDNSGGTIALTDRLQFWIRGAELTGRVVMSDLYVPVDSVDGKPIVDFVVAIMHDDRPNISAGVLVARVDPDEYLFPLLQAPNSTVESPVFDLAHRRGDAAASLLPVPRRSFSAYERLLDEHEAGSQVLAGRSGVFTGLDGQGRRTLATGRAIANTPWFIIATVGESVVLGPLQRAARISLVLAAAGLVMAGWLVAVWWRSERRVMAAHVDAAERRTSLLKEHFAIAGRFVHDIVLLLDETNAAIVEANDRAFDAYGYTREELLARSIFDLRPAGSHEERLARERFEQIGRTGSRTFVTRHWRKDGSSFPIEISARYCELDGRRFVQLVGRDVTERVRNEERLSQLSAERDHVLERLQRQFDQMATACVVLGVDGTVLQSNPAFERVFGFGAQQVMGRNVEQFVQSAPFLERLLQWRDHLREDPDATLAGTFDNIDGASRPITCRWTATALRGERGEFAGLIGMAENITEQTEAERALRDSEERYRTLTHISPVGIFRADLAGLTLFVNSRAAQIIGMDTPECLGLGWTRAIHPDDADETALALELYIASRGAIPYTPEFRIVHADGSHVWLLAQVAPERDLQGNVQGHIGTITDITQLKTVQLELRLAHDHLEERVVERTLELEQAKNAAEHSDRVKSAFLSTMSHELRTPLNSILGFTDVLLQGLSGPLNEAQQRQLQIVRDSSSHLRSLIEDVLDISRIEAGQIGLEFTDVDLHGLVSRRIEAFGPEYARKGIELRAEVAGALPVVRSDSKRTAQIVNNLLSNALKFTDSGSVMVRLRTLGDRLELQVIDTGIGIPPEAQDKLFNPFTQVLRPGGRLHEGTGLGLAISRNLARALGGDITMSSEAGRGSRFAFWLPLLVAERDGAAAPVTIRATDERHAIGAV